jgi:SAM-dependent methyltransferase
MTHDHHAVHGAEHSPEGTSASNLAISEQHAFVSGAIVGASRVLEVGSGRGHLARRLQADGFSVTAIDLLLPTRDDASGVRWVEGDFLTFDGGPFDAIVFTSSLHHLSPLGPALDRARQLLAPGGVLVVDDFDLEAPDEETARWYYEVQELLAVAGAYHPGHIDAGSGAAVARWLAAHEHHGAPLHPGRDMIAEIEGRFGSPEVARGPYLYRYICRGTPSMDVARHVLSVETRRIAEGILRPVGLRIVSRTR